MSDKKLDLTDPTKCLQILLQNFLVTDEQNRALASACIGTITRALKQRTLTTDPDVTELKRQILELKAELADARNQFVQEQEPKEKKRKKKDDV